MTYNVFGGTLSLTQSINQYNNTTAMQLNANISTHSDMGPV